MTELCLYQTVHVARGRARNVAAHAALLDAASRALFGRPYAPDPARLAARIEALAAAERYPAGVSGFVRLELTPEGGERLLAAGISLYDGYALRSLSPAAVTLRYDPLCPEAPTSAREAAELLAADSGLGFLITMGGRLGRPDIIVLGMICVGLSGAVIGFIIDQIEKKLLAGIRR